MYAHCPFCVESSSTSLLPATSSSSNHLKQKSLDISTPVSLLIRLSPLAGCRPSLSLSRLPPPSTRQFTSNDQPDIPQATTAANRRHASRNTCTNAHADQNSFAPSHGLQSRVAYLFACASPKYLAAPRYTIQRADDISQRSALAFWPTNTELT